MDILDVGLTIKEFRMEWTVKYTPNDITFWAPLLDSELPIQRLCAFELFIAWGRESVVKAYERWADCQARKVEIINAYNEKQAQFDKRFDDDYEMDYYTTSGGPYGDYQVVSRGSLRQAKYRRYADDTEYKICQMTWINYFNNRVLGKEV